MKLILKAGTTSRVARVYLQDASSTTGAGLTGLTSGSTGLKWSYIRDDQAAVTVVAPVTAVVGTWSTAGFKEIDPTKFPGAYEIGIPNAALASGRSVQMLIFGATGLVPCPIEIELVAYDPQAASNLGLANLDAPISSRADGSALPANFGALMISAEGAADANVTRVNGGIAATTAAVAANVTQWSGLPIATPDAAGHPRVTIKSGTGAGALNLASGNLAGSVASVAGSVGSVASGVTVADKTGFRLAPDGLDAISAADPGNPANHTTIARMLVAVWRSIHRKSTLTATQLKMYADDGTTVRSTQVVGDDGVTQTRGAAS